MNEFESMPERHLLVAVDATDTGQRAVLYVGDLLGGLPGFRVTIFHVVAQPPDDFFATGQQRQEWIDKHEAEGRTVLSKLTALLIQAGFEPDKVRGSIDICKCDSIAERIMEESDNVGACTVVLSRRRISKKEEFLFGSTTNKLLHSAKNCALWIVE